MEKQKQEKRKRLMVALNLDQNLRAELERIASSECRSVTQQIEHFLKAALKAFSPSSK